MPLGIRSRRDAGRLWLRHHWTLAASLGAGLLGVLAYVAPALALVIGLVGTFAGLLLGAVDLRNYRRNTRDLQIVKASHPDLKAIRPSKAYDNFDIERVGPGHLLRSPELDGALGTLPTVVELREPAHAVPASVSDFELLVVQLHRKQGELIFDGPGMRLETDPSTDLSGHASESRPLNFAFREARFFSSLATNELFLHEVVSRNSGRTLVRGWDLLVNEVGVMRDLDHARMTNLVGISTIAVCSDDRVVLVNQTHGNHASGGMLAPSGSGTLERCDLAAAESLQQAVANGMEREFREECNIPSGVGMSTTLTGFGRWLERGAKPEFFGVTTVDMSSREVHDRAVRRTERAYVGRVESLPVEALRKEGPDAGPSEANWSLPLAACVHRFREREVARER
jgi:hypothetical protein